MYEGGDLLQRRQHLPDGVGILGVQLVHRQAVGVLLLLHRPHGRPEGQPTCPPPPQDPLS